MMCLFSLCSFNPSLPSSNSLGMQHLSDCQTQRPGQWPAFGKVDWRLNAIICVLSTTEATAWILMQTLEKRKDPLWCVRLNFLPSTHQTREDEGSVRSKTIIRKTIFNVTFLSQSNLWGKVHASYLLFILKVKQSINHAI